MEKSTVKLNDTLKNNPNETEIFYKTKGEITR
jgi:hypothetical protein